MKKTILFMIGIFLLAGLNNSCKKSSGPPPPISVVGFWTGDLVQFPTSQGFDMVLNGDGSAKIYISSSSSVDTTTTTNTAVGTYTFIDSVFTATTTAMNGNVLKFNGKYSKTDPANPGTAPFLSGTWSQKQSSGSFGLNKY